MIQLIAQNRIGVFFNEAQSWLETWLFQQEIELPVWLLSDLIGVCRLNLQLAYKVEAIQAPFQSNLVEVCQAMQENRDLPLQKEPGLWVKDWPGAPFRVRKQAAASA